jgi:hypothetical protein
MTSDNFTDVILQPIFFDFLNSLFSTPWDREVSGVTSREAIRLDWLPASSSREAPPLVWTAREMVAFQPLWKSRFPWLGLLRDLKIKSGGNSSITKQILKWVGNHRHFWCTCTCEIRFYFKANEVNRRLELWVKAQEHLDLAQLEILWEILSRPRDSPLTESFYCDVDQRGFGKTMRDRETGRWGSGAVIIHDERCGHHGLE